MINTLKPSAVRLRLVRSLVRSRKPEELGRLLFLLAATLPFLVRLAIPSNAGG
jgi:hypothetical protein